MAKFRPKLRERAIPDGYGLKVAGIEPASGRKRKWPVRNGLWCKRRTNGRLRDAIESPPVPLSPLESTRVTETTRRRRPCGKLLRGRAIEFSDSPAISLRGWEYGGYGITHLLIEQPAGRPGLEPSSV